MLGVLFLFAFVGIFFAVFGFVIYRRLQAKSTWRAFADKHGFDFRDPGFFGTLRMSGARHGVEVTVSNDSGSSGNNSNSATVYQVRLPEGFPKEVAAHDDHFIFKMLDPGGEDVTVGAADIDDAFVFKSTEPERLRQLFEKPGVEEAFRYLSRSNGFARIRGGRLRLRDTQTSVDSRRLEDGVERVTSFANQLADALSGEEAERRPSSDSTRTPNRDGNADDGAAAAASAPQYDEEW